MKKNILACVLTICLLIGLIVPAQAYTAKENRIADALNELELFLGDGTGYALDNQLGRDDGITLLVRLLGKEEEAQSGGNFGMPFTDVPSWAASYVGYAWKNGITNGVSATQYGSGQKMSDNMFLTLVLRALNYTDKGENAQFTWDDPYELAARIGLIGSAEKDSDFTRGEAISIFWSALNTKYNGENVTLAERLISQGVFTTSEFNTAKQIAKNGRTESGTGDDGYITDSAPTPDTPAPDDPTPDTPTPDDPTPDTPTPDDPTPDTPTPDAPTPDGGVAGDGNTGGDGGLRQ